MLGFLVKTYPKISETFILQEILALQNQYPGFQIFAMQRPTDNNFHRACDQVTAKVEYLSNLSTGRSSPIAHLKLLCTKPGRYLNTILELLPRLKGFEFTRFDQAVRFAALAETNGIRHIHAHFASDPAGLAELVNRLSGITFSISAHAKDIYLSDPGDLRRKMGRAEFVVTCTDYNRRYLQSINFAHTPIYRIYHGIDPVRIRSESHRKIDSSPVPRILSVGRLREKKGFSFLIGACQLLVRAGYEFRCDIAGYGPDYGFLAALINRYQLTGVVRLLGKMTHNDLIALYRDTCIFALPSIIANDGDRDGIPNVLMEAMVFSIPVVTTPVSGIPELVEHRKSGLWVEPENAFALFEALKLLLDRPELRKQLGVAGASRVAEKFSADQNIVELKALLANAVYSRDTHNISQLTPKIRHG